MQLNLNKPADVLASLKRAVAAGGELAREALRNDHRFDPARQSPEFQSIISATDLTPMRFDSFTH
jgi:hypothetical protein